MSVCHQLLSSCLFCLRASSLICQEPLFSSSGPLLLNLPRDSSAALKLRPLMLNLCCEASLFLVSRHSPLEDTQFKPPKKTSCNGAGPFKLLISKRGGSRHKPNYPPPPPPPPCTHCIGRAEMPFQSLLLFCFCFTAFVSQLFLMHDFCYKNVFARPPFCLLACLIAERIARTIQARQTR